MAMQADKEPKSSKDQIRDARKERLAQALRQNLRRRKEQTRARDDDNDDKTS